jgi:hypothetical protein
VSFSGKSQDFLAAFDRCLTFFEFGKVCIKILVLKLNQFSKPCKARPDKISLRASFPVSRSQTKMN